jgi:exopolysaccharide production protein ExoZ
MIVDKTAATPQPKLLSIQYLRAIAALLVVFHHAHNNALWLYNPLASYGADARGVDIFFVISGFVMFTAARDESPGTFISRRLIRIVPLYWLATLAFVLLSAQVSGSTLIRSLFFIPSYNPFYIGEIWPILIPGWTLNYEVFFYAIFALALFSRRLIMVLVAVIGSLVIVGPLYLSTNALWLTYTSPMLLEFLGGVVLAVAFDRARERRNLWRWSAGFLPLAVVALLVSDQVPLPLILSVGVPAMMIVGGALSLEVHGLIPDMPALRLVGDASYAIYLSHIIVIGFCGIVVQASELTGIPQLLAMLTLSMIVSTIVGIWVHRKIEKPILRFLNRHLFPRTEACRNVAHPA